MLKIVEPLRLPGIHFVRFLKWFIVFFIVLVVLPWIGVTSILEFNGGNEGDPHIGSILGALMLIPILAFSCIYLFLPSFLLRFKDPVPIRRFGDWLIRDHPTEFMLTYAFYTGLAVFLAIAITFIQAAIDQRRAQPRGGADASSDGPRGSP